MANAEVFDSFFRKADLDRDGRISGSEAVGFFQGSGLPQATLAKIWQFSDQNRAGFLSRQEFINALKLVTVAQTGRDLTPELVKAALNGPAASQIPPPRINIPTTPPSNFSQTPPAQTPLTAPQSIYGQQFPAQTGHGQKFGSQGGLGLSHSSLDSGISPVSQLHGRPSSVGSVPQGGPITQVPPRPGFSAGASGVTQTRPTLGGLMGSSSLPSGAQFPTGSNLSTGPGFQSFRPNSIGPTGLVPTTPSSSSSLAPNPSGVSQTPNLGSAYSARPLSGPGVTPPWPQMSANDVQRYTRVFSKVDTDQDGKITGEQARQLFLGWKLPREVLKQVWNLSDQDGDSMLSTREFCTALYLMERFREGRPLPPRLPPGIHLDDPRAPEGQIPAGQRPGYGNSNWQQGNMQQMGPGSAPIRPTLLTTPAGQMQLQSLTSSGAANTEPPKDAFGEFNFLNRKKPSDKESPSPMHGPNSMPGQNPTPKGIEVSLNKATTDRRMMDQREKSAYYRTKLQEIVLFKSRCDNKLSEITEKAAADKREVDSLAKKYDEKFKAAAEVNAQLAVENANLRDAQEKKMELLDALFKMEHGGDPNALLQKRADHIATDLDKLKKALRDRGQLLGVEVKQKIPKEMPFGWMKNLEEKAAEWDNWDDLMDRDFSVIEDLTDESTTAEKPSATASWGKEGNNSAKIDSSSASDTNIIEVEEVPSIPEPGLIDKTSQTPSEVSSSNEAVVSSSAISTLKPSSDLKAEVTPSVSATKASGRYANVTESQEFGSDLFDGSTAASSPTSSSEVGRGSFTPDAFAGIGSSWGFGSNEDDVDSGSRASWGLQSNPPSTQASLDVSNTRTATRFSKSSGSFDLGSPRTSSIDGTSSAVRAAERNGSNHSHDFDSVGGFGSKDSNKMSSLFGGNSSPKATATPSLFGGSPKASNQSDDFSSFSRFDSFGPGGSVAPPRASAAGEDRPSSLFNRFDSFNSVQGDGARGSGFHSDDESNIFSAPKPYSAKQSHVSDAWKAF